MKALKLITLISLIAIMANASPQFHTYISAVDPSHPPLPCLPVGAEAILTNGNHVYYMPSEDAVSFSGSRSSMRMSQSMSFIPPVGTNAPGTNWPPPFMDNTTNYGCYPGTNAYVYPDGTIIYMTNRHCLVPPFYPGPGGINSSNPPGSLGGVCVPPDGWPGSMGAPQESDYKINTSTNGNRIPIIQIPWNHQQAIDNCDSYKLCHPNPFKPVKGNQLPQFVFRLDAENGTNTVWLPSGDDWGPYIHVIIFGEPSTNYWVLSAPSPAGPWATNDVAHTTGTGSNGRGGGWADGMVDITPYSTNQQFYIRCLGPGGSWTYGQ